MLRLVAAWLALALAPGLALTATAVTAEAEAEADIVSARYKDATTRYGHAILGDNAEWGTLEITLSNGKRRSFILPETRVYEDLEPRLVDLDGDGQTELMVIETDVNLGSQLAIYGPEGKITATPNIGRSFRWLAPLGAADLDGDGKTEIAYIDKPHLAKVLRVWRYDNQKLTLVADKPGLTNHSIGQDFISGGIRDCGAGPEIVTANANWTKVMATKLSDGVLTTRELGRFHSLATLRAAVACES